MHFGGIAQERDNSYSFLKKAAQRVTSPEERAGASFTCGQLSISITDRALRGNLHTIGLNSVVGNQKILFPLQPTLARGFGVGYG